MKQNTVTKMDTNGKPWIVKFCGWRRIIVIKEVFSCTDPNSKHF